MQRIALGLSYVGQGYLGWQSQTGGNTLQDKLEAALAAFCGLPKGGRVITNCAGRTDAGVHGLMQVVHFDTTLQRDVSSWVRGTNSYLPSDIAVQWAKAMPAEFHSRGSAVARRYAYVLLESAIRPSIEAGRVGWVHRPLDLLNMQLGCRIFTWRKRFFIIPRCAMPSFKSCKNHAPYRHQPTRPLLAV